VNRAKILMKLVTYRQKKEIKLEKFKFWYQKDQIWKHGNLYVYIS